MPNIEEYKRQAIDPVTKQLLHILAGLEADDDNNNMEDNVCYIITKLLKQIYNQSNITEALGVLELAKLEHYNHHLGAGLSLTITNNEQPGVHLDEIVVEQKESDQL